VARADTAVKGAGRPGSVALDPPEGLDLTCGLHLTRLFVPQPEPSEPPSPLQRLTAALGTPDSITAGTTLVYVVELTNPTDQAATWTPAPYIQSARRPAAIKDIEALDYAPVGEIAAHHSVRLEMRMPIPVDTSAGTLKIFWSLVRPDVTSLASAEISVITAPSSAPAWAAGHPSATQRGVGKQASQKMPPNHRVSAKETGTTVRRPEHRVPKTPPCKAKHRE
jgi:hypothetical protein